MNLLPFAERAFADERKLLDYCPNPDHSIGKHKAHVFASVFGIMLENWTELYG